MKTILFVVAIAFTSVKVIFAGVDNISSQVENTQTKTEQAIQEATK